MNCLDKVLLTEKMCPAPLCEQDTNTKPNKRKLAWGISRMTYECWHRWWQSDCLLMHSLDLVLGTCATNFLRIRHFSHHPLTYPRINDLLSLAMHCKSPSQFIGFREIKYWLAQISNTEYTFGYLGQCKTVQCHNFNYYYIHRD